jgi:sugar phosphate isomerase/epimerase
MRVGVDGRKIPQAKERGPLGSLDHAQELGMEGVFFRTVLDMSPTLDEGALREIRSRADALNLYLETGLGKVNPYCLPETPEVRAIGDGDTLLGFERMMRACQAIGCRELWVGTANIKPQYLGLYSYDRYRTDAPWADQLVATARFLQRLAPIARDLGIHLNVETHEEITSFEVVRLVEAVGPDVMGVTFDVGNVLQRGESPLAAARRVAPYVRQTHIKDAILAFAPDGAGVVCQFRPCGEGGVDFDAILPLLAAHSPNLHLSIENINAPGPGHVVIPVFDATWQASHPDLTVAELAEFVELAVEGDRRIAAGEWLDVATYDARPFGFAEEVDYIRTSADHLRQVIARHDLVAA